MSAAVPEGWRFERKADADGARFISIYAPPPAAGLTARTSDAVYERQNRDLYDLLGRLADQQADNSPQATSDEIEAARNIYQDDNCQIDDDALVNHADGAYWVSAWVRVRP